MDLSELIKIYDRNKCEIPIRKGLPADKQNYHIQGAEECYARIDENNVMLFHSVDLGDIDICISHYLMDGNTKFYASANRYTLEAHNLLEGYVQYRLKGFKWRRIKEGEYNIIYLDEVEDEVLVVSPSITMDFQISEELLFRLAKEYPELRPFADDVRSHRKTSFYDKFHRDSPKAMFLLTKIMNLLITGEGKSKRVKELSMQAVRALVTAKNEKFRYRYTYEQIERLYTASEMLIKHMGDEDILKIQMAKTKFNEAKFREGFKSMFGITPMHFLMSARMDLVEELVLQRHTLTEICRLIPYHEPKHLEEAFFDTKGYHIKDIRMKRSYPE